MIERDRKRLMLIDADYNEIETMRLKKIHVDRCRIEWDRNYEIEKDRRDFRLTKR